MKKTILFINAGMLLLAGLMTVAFAEDIATSPDDIVSIKQSFDCVLSPNKLIKISSPVPGVIGKMNVQRGDLIKKGKILFLLRAEQEQAAVNLMKAKYMFGKRTVERNEDLYSKNLISIHEKDEMETDARLAELGYREALVALRLKTIKSPINGLVVERLQHEGEAITEQPVVHLVNLDPLHVDVVLPVSYLGEVKQGSVATITLRNPAIKQYEVTVDIIDPVVDPASDTYRVRLLMRNPDNRVPSGLKCQVVF